MSTEDDLQQLQSAVRSIWVECGETPPHGEELQRAAVNLRQALAMGRRVTRQMDKTLQPMAARRNDLERALHANTASALPSRPSLPQPIRSSTNQE